MNTATRIVLAGVLGAVAMLAWSSAAHMATPLGTAGFQMAMDDEALLSAMKTTVKDKPGLYIFPTMGVGPEATSAEQNAAREKYPEKMEKNPSGLLLYHPAGSRPMEIGKSLTIEFITQLVTALLAVWLLAQTRIVTFGGRVGFVTAAGFMAAITIYVSYWNWFGYPGVHVASYIFVKVVGFFLVGVVAAIMFRRVTA